MSSLFQRSLLERLHHVEKALELAGSVMGELGNSQGPRAGVVIDCCREFMLCREFCAQRYNGSKFILICSYYATAALQSPFSS
ncbi:mediator of RNA polymerase II transcription subunit 11-like isoform X3 [Hordeum vulgare subsp. vulgare]|uniref:mediator of RNA polymerase II transcription subunit 11-like isoform X3 n=1 Tax=Hordeum vulgare subsp. vulgare TaxID=112509 RepID=UPI001D1A515C|nr:mediator of RNA polymerase II transcription subunit 11-like isoform X3 [Hordeum vulgare subsp. vulgare]